MWGRGALGALQAVCQLHQLRQLLLLSCIALLSLTEGSGRMSGGRLFGPRMDYDEWTPLGRGDPLKNDPTYDYVPPVLERVHYWVDPKEGGLRRDSALDPFVKFVESPLPVPPTMLVPPPYQPPPPPPPPPPPMSTTPALLPMPPPSSYSSLNPFHHFEDHPVVANIHFEERPGASLHFESPVVSNVFEEKPLEKPLLGPDKHLQARPVSLMLFEDKPTSGGNKQAQHAQPTANTIRFEDKPAVNKVHLAAPVAVNTTVKPATAPARRPQNTSSASPPAPPPTADVRPGPRPAPPASGLRPSATYPPPPATSSSLALPPKPTTAFPALIKNLLHQEVATTASSLTTDPLFSHYKQPAIPVHGPPYLIIQGHSKVKTYGPSKPTSIHGIPVHVHARNAIRRAGGGPHNGHPVPREI